jgi:LmbE family N-acetylglucosaminyl deacetylase
MQFFKGKRVLFIAPHVDDIEYCCSGTISKINKVAEIHYLSFSFAEKSLPKGFSAEDFKEEMFLSVGILRIKRENVINKYYPVREFSKYRQEILDDLVEIRKDINPDIVFIPNSMDTHQDHRVISEEGFRAFKSRTIFGYESLLNNKNFNCDMFITLEEKDFALKVKSIESYKSQVVKRKDSIEAVKSLMKLRGFQANAKYAEAFEVMRMIL